MERPVSSPGVLSPAFAKYLRMTKKQLLGASNADGYMLQTGGAYVGDGIDIPGLTVSADDDAQIETFLVDADGTCTATGMNEGLIEPFLPAVREMVACVLSALSAVDVALEFPAYITASTTPLAAVSDMPHFDDDQYVEEAGVGVVAIAANVDGPRVACTPLAHEPARPGLPFPLDPTAAEEFEAGSMATQSADANRIVLFPQFGQLHSGPGGAGPTSLEARSLLVFRASTTPQ